MLTPPPQKWIPDVLGLAIVSPDILNWVKVSSVLQVNDERF
jgi:hypothetical protein